MGVSFKVSKVGTRYKRNFVHIEDKGAENASSSDSQQRIVEESLSGIRVKIVDDSNKKARTGQRSMLEGLEVSFSLNLFKDGYFLGKATELLSDVPRRLHPYDRGSETLFSAIEYGWLPGDLLNDIPCKYVNGVLLCEIRDYRDSLHYKEGHTYLTRNSPVVHKVILQICMETVIKDILSSSNDSWTYRDLLEIESCIIKALQPDLHLNPEPLWGEFCGEPPRKKLDLGIAWSWKKRKLSDVSGNSLPIINPNPVNSTLSDCPIQKPSLRSGPVNKNRKATNMQECIFSSCHNPQGTSHCLDSTLPSSMVVVPKTPNLVPIIDQVSPNERAIYEKQAIINRISLSQRSIYENEAIKELTSKIPKEEPVDLPQLQLQGSHVDITNGDVELQWPEKSSQQQLKVDKIPCEREKNKFHSPQLMHDQMVLQGIQNLLAGAPSVKQEPVETSGLNSDNSLGRRMDQSNLHNSKSQFPSTLLSTDSSSMHTLWNHMAQPFERILNNGRATQKRKSLHNSKVISEFGSLSETPCNSNSLQKTTPVHVGVGQKGSNAEGLGIQKPDLVTVRSLKVASPNVPKVPLPQPSTEVDAALERFVKILGVTERHGLTNRKRKFDQLIGSKPFFTMASPLVGFYLSSVEDSGKSKDSNGDKITFNHSNYWKIKTVIYCYESLIHQRSDSEMIDKNAQIRLVIAENLNLGTVEARVYYGCEGEIDSIPFAPRTYITSIYQSDICVCTGQQCSMDFFANQFTKLMEHEGYHKVSDKVESSSFDKNGESGIAIPSASNASSITETIKSPVSTPMKSSPCSAMPFHGTMQSSFLNILSQANFAPGEKRNSLSDLACSYLFKPQVDIAPQVRPVQQQWPQSPNKFSLLQLQMQLRHSKEQEMLRRKQSISELNAAARSQNTGRPDGGIHGIRDISSGSRSNLMGIKGSMPILAGRQDYLNNFINRNNCESHLSGLNDKQLLSMLSDHRFPDLSKMNNTRQGLGRDLMSGLPALRNAGSVAFADLDAFDMKYLLKNHMEPQTGIIQQLHMVQHQDCRPLVQHQEAEPQTGMIQQLHMVQQEDCRPLLQHQEGANLVGNVATPLRLVSPPKDRQAHLNVQQLSPVLAVQQMNPGNISVSESPEVSSRTHGSVNSSKN